MFNSITNYEFRLHALILLIKEIFEPRPTLTMAPD